MKDEILSFLAQGRDAEQSSVAYKLRVCDAEHKARAGQFQWPSEGAVECPDWSPEPQCGAGLHGWLWGEGNAEVAEPQPLSGTDSRWLVVAVWAADVVDLRGKVKVPRGWVVFSGKASDAANEITRLGARGAVIYGTATAGGFGTATAGSEGTLQIRYQIGGRERIATAYVGEKGIKRNTAYKLDAEHQFVEKNT